MLRTLFSAGYRRVECAVPALDLGRRRLLERSGFSLEGVHRKFWIVDDRSRDAAVYACLNTDWRAGGQEARLAAALGVVGTSYI